ncbi:MAG TPA: hypothetical protein PKK26_10190 [Candidatus Wallbacteria bacterium]|nr:hypothetical protein [Candidatus Wallbacteria bacterium]
MNSKKRKILALFVIFVCVFFLLSIRVQAATNIFNQDVGKPVASLNKDTILKVVSLDVSGGDYRAADLYKVMQIGNLLKPYAPDVVFLTQVVEGKIYYSNQIKVIGDKLGLKYYTFAGNPMKESDTAYNITHNIVDRGGVAILSRYPLTEVRQLEFAGYYNAAGRTVKYAAAKTKINNKDVAFVCAYMLSTSSQSTIQQKMIQLSNYLKSNYKNIPIIISGNFQTKNISEEDIALCTLKLLSTEGFRVINKKYNYIQKPDRGANYPVKSPTQKRQHIFSTGHFSANNAFVCNGVQFQYYLKSLPIFEELKLK